MLKKIGYLCTIPIVSINTYVIYKSFAPIEKRLNIVFDLDHTLVHCEKKTTYNKFNMSHVKMYDAETNNYYLWKRPFLVPTLWFLSKFNNLHLMTRATSEYATNTLTAINIDNFFQSKYHREDKHCINKCKDIKKICDNNKIILVDDLLTNRCEDDKFYHIPQCHYYSNYDMELLKLSIYILYRNLFDSF
jgi:hypothetical protein